MAARETITMWGEKNHYTTMGGTKKKGGWIRGRESQKKKQPETNSQRTGGGGGPIAKKSRRAGGAQGKKYTVRRAKTRNYCKLIGNDKRLGKRKVEWKDLGKSSLARGYVLVKCCMIKRWPRTRVFLIIGRGTLLHGGVIGNGRTLGS